MDLDEQLTAKIRTLVDAVWGLSITKPDIDRWLSNFRGKSGQEVAMERRYALYLLTNVMYFGQQEVRELLRAIYRDLFEYPIIERIRRSNSDTLDTSLISRALQSELSRTIFVGVGNPADSGVHLLYYFRQENNLATDRFEDAKNLLTNVSGVVRLKNPQLRRYIFLDDVCGSGRTVSTFAKNVVTPLLAVDPTLEVRYLCMFATQRGLDELRRTSAFGAQCHALFELDDTYKCVSDGSRYFSGSITTLEAAIAKSIAQTYGADLWSRHPLGFQDGQLLLTLAHNTPNNTLPIMWCDSHGDTTWTPIFKRYAKP